MFLLERTDTIRYSLEHW